jgi:spectinomycin phosphotransferase
VLERVWGIRVAAMTYMPVGWGSHHWEVADRGRNRWFVTVDELEAKRFSASESLDHGFARLRASLLSAVELADAGCEFVVAPVPTTGNDGEPVVRLGSRFAVAVYPFVDGRSFAWRDGDTRGTDPAGAREVRRTHAPGTFAAGTAGAHPRRAASGQYDADRRGLAAHRLGHRPRRAARARPVDSRPRRRVDPRRLRGRDRDHSPAGTSRSLPALLGHQGPGLRREPLPAAAYRESGR